MYCQIKEVEELIEKLISSEGKNPTFYRNRIKKFFTVYIDKDKPLDAITYYDVNKYLDEMVCSADEKLNRYNALKAFFTYTLTLNKTKVIMDFVIKPIGKPHQNIFLSNEDFLKLKEYIYSNEDINDRLLLALFLFTGLGRQYIVKLNFDDIVKDDGQYKLKILKGNEWHVLPIKAELQLLIQEYLFLNNENDGSKRITKFDDSVISTYVGKLTSRILNKKKITPTVLSNTFIHYALLSGNNLWEISKLILKDVQTIDSRISLDEDLYNKQKSVLNSF
ncbi:MAG: hypothetical protein CVU99_08380 [Firmicutes bacterium HGW-Firmicutes-4]|jgi:integrase|nr:MAG: hypothetical protein CVU99_08380 [Firmicutes bacterium HGW-Firmicutes-4]